MQSLVDIIKTYSKPLSPIATDCESKLPALEGIKCVLFDVYGTLMVSGVGDISHSSDDNRANAIKSVSTELGMPLNRQVSDPGEAFKAIIIEHQELQRKKGIQYPEVDIREVWLEFLTKNNSVENITNAEHPAVEELSIRFELSVNPTWPMPFLRTTTAALKEANIKLGIVSNAQFFTPLLFNAYTQKSLDEMGFEDRLCQWSYFYKEAKPSNHLYSINADILESEYDISPDEVLYVGNDMLNDVTPAQEVGFKTALFAGDKRSLRMRENDPRTEGVVPDLIIRSLDEIIGCIIGTG